MTARRMSVRRLLFLPVLLALCLRTGAATGQIPGLPVTDVDPMDAGELRWYLNLDDTLPFAADGSPRWTSKTIDEDLSLGPGNNPYVICEGVLNVTNGATLTIEAGTEIYIGGGGGIYVNGGSIVGSGASGDSAVISSIDVIDANGTLIWANLENPELPHIDWVGDGVAARGDWARIECSQGSTADLSYTAIRYGTVGLYLMSYGGTSSGTIDDCAFAWHAEDGMRHTCEDDTTTILTDSRFDHNGDNGLYLDGNSARILRCTFTGNDDRGVLADGIGAPTIDDCGFYDNADAGLFFAALIDPVVTGCTFDGNGGYGLEFLNEADDAPPITGCTFTNNHRPLLVPINLLPAKRQTEGDDNIYSPNEVNVIALIGRPLTGTDYTFPLEVKHRTGGRIPVTTYEVEKGDIVIGSAYALEVDAGVVFKGCAFNGLYTTGDLRIIGAPNEAVVFTAKTDDEYGNTAYGEEGDSGDTNEDGTATEPEPGYWDGVGVSGAGASTTVENAIFRYGIDGLTCANMDTIDIRHVTADRNSDNGLWISGGLPATIRDVFLEANGGDGFYIAQNSASVDSLTSRLSGAHGVRTRPTATYTHVVADSNALHGFYIESGDPTLSYATLTNNGGHGLYTEGGWSSPPIEHVTMTGNRMPCRLTFSMLSPRRMTESDTNVYSPNEINVIEVRGNYPVDTSDHSIPFDIKHAGSRTAIPITTYHIVANDLYVPSGYTLEVDPGVVVKGDFQHRIRVAGGRFEAVGTEDQRIAFTCYRDDSVGNTAYGEGGDSGDTNDDGASSGAPDDWDGIDVDGSGTVRLEYVDMRYADDNLSMSVNSGLGIIAEIRNSTFCDAVDDGLYISGGTGDTLALEGCLVRGNLDDGIELGAVAGEVRDCVITHHSDRGVSATSYLKPAFMDNVVAENGIGLYLYNAAAGNMSGNAVAYNDRGVVTGSNNTSVIGGSPAAANSIFSNRSYGVQNLDDAPDITATYNWWGAASGPYDPSDDTGSGGDYNPAGGGDVVTDDVVYRPWTGSGAAGAGDSVTLPPGDGSPVRVPGTGVAIDSESGPGGDVTVLEIPVRPPADTTLVMASRHWLLMSDDLANGEFRADVCFYLEGGDLPGGVEADSLVVCLREFSDTTWVALPTTVDADSLKYCVSNLAQTAVFAIGGVPKTGVDDDGGPPEAAAGSDAIRLLPATPNPFGEATTVHYAIPTAAAVRVGIYDAAGRLVRVLADGPHASGEHEVTWGGLDSRGRAVAPGIYFCMMESAGHRVEMKVVLLK